MRPQQRPIGIFDSGVGGLTVANAVVRLLPKEEIIYFGDTAHLPYGEKSAGAIQRYSEDITRFLIGKGCKLIIIACNSASATAYQHLMDTFGGAVPILNVIDPLVEEVAKRGFQKVGVLATKATVTSGVYERQLASLAPQLEVVPLAAPLLVPMIEEGYFNHRISHAIIKDYISRPELEDVDALMLCCTHYPLIRKEIEDLFHRSIAVFDNGEAMAATVRVFLSAKGWLNDCPSPHHQFFVSDYTESFEQTTRLFYGEKVSLQECFLP